MTAALRRLEGEAIDLIKQLNAARDRLDCDTALMQRAIDLRERLWFGLDLDDMRAEVAAFKRACSNFRNGFSNEKFHTRRN
jgi:hypothetical protein